MKFAKWLINGYDRPVAVSLCHSGINPLVSVFLASRGIASAVDAKTFLRDDISLVEDPFLLPDMAVAADRIKSALKSREHIAVYGDYDVDGMTASTLLASFLRSNGAECEIYIPARTDEGYGVNCSALDGLISRGNSLIITVDCGITANVETEYAHSRGADIIITDHHECRDVLPEALAVINPKRRDSDYPNKSLAGVGVVFKLICAVEGPEHTERLLAEYGEFVAMGTVADVMLVTGENRALIRRGINSLNSSLRPGLRRLIAETCHEKREIRAETIGFGLAPRLNAAGRMGRTSLSVKLLLTDSDEEAEALSTELCALNEERRRLESEIYDEAVQMIGNIHGEYPIVLARRGWCQGVMGIVAARLAERFLSPVVMISLDDNGVGRGSCRSAGDFNMYAALDKCSDLLRNFGGHEMAAGLTLDEGNIDAFRSRLCGYYREAVKSPPVPTLAVDFEVINPKLLTLQNVSALDTLEPFGSGNMPPLLCIKGADVAQIAPVGQGKHTKMRVNKAGRDFDCIWFSKPAAETGISAGDTVDIAFEPQINEFRGKRKVQLVLSDLCRHAGK